MLECVLLFFFYTFHFNTYVATWHDPANRRLFLENYARVNGFDPLDPQAWNSQSIKKIKSHKVVFICRTYVRRTYLKKKKRVRSILAYHGASFSKALSELFPEMGLTSVSYGANSKKSNKNSYYKNIRIMEGRKEEEGVFREICSRARI